MSSVRRPHCSVVVSTLTTIYVVNRHWAQLVPGWVDLPVGKPSRYVTSHLGQLSLPFLQSRSIEYRPVWLGLRPCMFACVGWQVTLCDPKRQVTLRSCEMGFH